MICRHCANHCIHRRAILKDNHVWYAHNAVFLRQIHGFINIHLYNFRLSLVFCGKLLQNGAHHLAGAAPCRGKVHQYGHLAFQYLPEIPEI